MSVVSIRVSKISPGRPRVGVPIAWPPGPGPCAFQAGHIPSCCGSCERYALSPVAAASGWSLLLLSRLCVVCVGELRVVPGRDRRLIPRVDGTFIWIASHDQRQCSLSTVSCAVAIAAGPQPRSRWGARSEASPTWAAARIPAVSWIRPLAVAKTVRWSSQKVTGLLWANPPSFGAYRRLRAMRLRMAVATSEMQITQFCAGLRPGEGSVLASPTTPLFSRGDQPESEQASCRLNTGQHTTVLAVRMTTWLQTKRRGRGSNPAGRPGPSRWAGRRPGRQCRSRNARRTPPPPGAAGQPGPERRARCPGGPPPPARVSWGA